VNGHSTIGTSAFLSNPGSVYDGYARIDTQYSTSNNRNTHTLPVLKLPQSVTSTGKRVNNNNNNNTNQYQPAEFTLATFSPDKSVSKPTSRHSRAAGLPPTKTDPQAKLRTVSKSMQKV